MEKLSIDISFADNDTRYVPREEYDFCGLCHETRYQYVFKNFDIAGKSILDFGCGTGYGTYILSKKAKKAIGIDYSQQAVNYAIQKYSDTNTSFFIADACSEYVATIFDKNEFDFIVSFDVIEHLERYFDYIKNICNLLKEDGILIIGCPNRWETFNWNINWNRYHFQEFSPYQIRKILGLYFNKVELIAQDWADFSLREKVRKELMNDNFKVVKNFMYKTCPYFVKMIIKRITNKVFKKNFSYEDISFVIEPGEEKLKSSFGIIAICRDVKK